MSQKKKEKRFFLLNALGEDHIIEGVDEGDFNSKEVVRPSAHTFNPKRHVLIGISLIVVLKFGGELRFIDLNLSTFFCGELRLAGRVTPDEPVVVGTGGSGGGGGGNRARGGDNARSNVESTEHFLSFLCLDF